ncbi:benzoate 4-monooxygenase cytochrome P450, putative [Talaromyces stipitatus ATCC 10500]|uniref:Benzoate 4-monooxygenase cytochrome P450, putative n=1 Tax=Talaromyces stipitatus (strain ATCC 10500 / CBS 375.48 / QM 6759 / NRRL 1006) TaxID=441959 RepID=B8LXP3_TALSN|nr:benzoate 4-monooxygenase cytochrome P450, putative [Talaromyces stipitatus ATCC 10500]EED24544.1 benzoate 4-monooxygenase cytochrome P450, putative [Talaromyces stipitatus ATCC 10500]
MLAMTKYPETQKKGQAEIDAIIDEGHSPTWADYGRLPYVAAITKEFVRWRPVAPLGMPHSLDEDEWIDGKLIAKGTALILNIWGLNHDERYHKNADEFDLSRYVNKTLPALDYRNFAYYDSRDHYRYGAGCRLCTDVHIAE